MRRVKLIPQRVKLKPKRVKLKPKRVVLRSEPLTKGCRVRDRYFPHRLGTITAVGHQQVMILWDGFRVDTGDAPKHLVRID